MRMPFFTALHESWIGWDKDKDKGFGETGRVDSMVIPALKDPI